MKKIKVLLASVCAVALTSLCMCGLVACGEADDFQFRAINNGTEYELTYIFDDVSSVKIPSTYNGKPVTSIGDVYLGPRITSVEIPDSVTNIGNYAFSGGDNLTNVTIPANLTRIGNYAFSGCSNLTNITIPASVRDFSKNAFPHCDKLIQTENGLKYIDRFVVDCDESVTSVVWRDGTIGIANDAFSECTDLTSIEIPSSIKSICYGALSGCGGLTEITVESGNTTYFVKDNCVIETESKTLVAGCKSSVIPADGSATSIGDYAFSGCSGLTDVDIGNSLTIGDNRLTSIGAYAFYNCPDLTYATVGVSVSSIGEGAFSACPEMYGANLRANITTLSDYTFRDCSKLGGVRLPDTLESIGKYAFDRCSKLTDIELQKNVKSIDESAFNGCSALASITVDDNNSVYSSRDGILYNKEQTEFIFIPPAVSGAVRIPDAITAIEDLAFWNNRYLTSMTIGSGVTSIGDRAFADCRGLTSIVISSSVTRIGNNVLNNCNSLTSITVQDGNSKYRSVNNCLIEISSKTLLRGCSDSVIPDDGSVTSIGSGAFSCCYDLTEIELPISVTSIGSNAFYHCFRLVSVKLSDNLTEIGDGAFSECSALESIEIPNGVTAIGDETFNGCYGLKSIKISGNIKSIGDRAFSVCSEMERVEFNGTKAQWQAIIKGEGWFLVIGNSDGVICSDGVLTWADFEF